MWTGPTSLKVALLAVGMATSARAEEVCVSSETLEDQAVLRQLVALRIESQKRGLDVVWSSEHEACGDEAGRLELTTESAGRLESTSVVAAEIVVDEETAPAEAIAREVVGLLTAVEADEMVSLLGEQDQLLMPKSSRDRPLSAGLAVGTQMLTLSEVTTLGVRGEAQLRMWQGRALMGIAGGWGQNIAFAGDADWEDLESFTAYTYDLMGVLRGGPKFGKVWIRGGVAVGGRWSRVAVLEGVPIDVRDPRDRVDEELFDGRFEALESEGQWRQVGFSLQGEAEFDLQRNLSLSVLAGHEWRFGLSKVEERDVPEEWASPGGFMAAISLVVKL